MRISLALFSCLLAVSAVAAPAPPTARLKALEQEAAASKARAADLAARSAALQRDLATQRNNLTKAAADVRAGEEVLSSLESEKDVLAARLAGESQVLGAQRASLAQLTAALVRLARIPPGGLLISEDAPIDAARAERLIGAALARAHDGAQAASQEMARLDAIDRELDGKRREAAAAALTLKSRQLAMATLVEKRQALYQQTDSDRKAEEDRAAKIAEQAQDLRDLVARIEAEQAEEARREAEQRRRANLRKSAPPKESPGHFTRAAGLPVAGEIKTRFGQDDGLGGTARGITIAARPGATVTSPAAGTVRFAGPFRGYREILILEHPGGYHSVIAGLSRISAALGTAIGAGEPVGAMDDRSDARPELYYELRRNGQPIDPEAVSAPVDVKGTAR